jgi:hypothetical protein
MAGNAEDLQEMEADVSTEPVNKNKRYRKPKPWDTDDIDHVPSLNLLLQPSLLEIFC